ncbi:hypothetical protein N431DRAFT_549493 [Stipitochalara longipes BDJ]|nr:hypothetical protein N431DRAFT_549493 [Stipitochalara longipes BDJ]
MNEHNPSGTRSSLDESLRPIGASSVPQWQNFPIEEEPKNQQDDQRSTISTTQLPRRLPQMGLLFPIRDISWIVAFSFTIGSTAFVVNGFFLLLPFIDPETKFPNETPYATPASSVLGAFIFLIGGYAGFLEALNLGGEKVTVTNTQSERPVQIRPLRASISTVQTGDAADEVQATSLTPLLGDSAFVYLPTMHQLRKTYAHSLPFHAGWVQLLGTLVFSMATLTSLPGVLTSSPSLVPVLNLLPATLGGLLFIIGSVLQTLNAQEKWWIPHAGKGDWQVGFWNVIGSLGFTLAGAMPVLGTETATYVGTLADFWGSWAFLIGSVVQLYIVMGYYA